MSARILIVDDEAHIRRVMRMTLEASGYEVGEAADGLRGLEAFGDGSTWDAVLLDQRMPGIDGLETLRRMKGRKADACIIMVTAYGSIELAVDAMKLGATDFVRKPMTPETVRNAVSVALARPTAPAQAPEQAPMVVSRLTLNGFRLWPISEPPGLRSSGSSVRRFTVRQPDGQEQEVIVEIDPGAIRAVEHATHRQFPSDSSFWTWEAERALNDFLWIEGRVPPGGRLTIHQVSRNHLQVAAAWDSEGD